MLDKSNNREPAIERIRHELCLRQLTVESSSRLTPNMVRLVLTGDDLATFTSLSPDDHVKVFVPSETHSDPVKRDYTPRHYDAERRTLTLDFAVHDQGPATQWALTAKAGDTLKIGGPRGSQVITGDIDHWLLIGDESALPAIARRVDELATDARATTVVCVPVAEDAQSLVNPGRIDSHWLPRNQRSQSDAQAIIQILDTITLPPNTFVWLAGESGMVKAVKSYLAEHKNITKPWIKAAGYWKQGVADSSEKFDE